MKKPLILIIIFSLTYNSLFSQRLRHTYRGLSSDETYQDHLLEFKSDSTLEIRTFPRHMSQGFRIILKYKKEKNKITLVDNVFSFEDSSKLISNGFKQFLREPTLIRKGNFWIDEEHKTLYASNKKFEKKYTLIYIINGKKYRQETSSPNAYGLLPNDINENKVLNDTLAALTNKMDYHTINVYKGLSAYRKYGQKYIYGVIVIERK